MGRWALGLGLALWVAGCGRPDPAPPVIPVTAAEFRRVITAARAKAVLVNVWATWCGPCREELPDLVRLERDGRAAGLKVLLVSADSESDLPQVKRFLAQHGVCFPTYFKAQKDMEFINGLDPRWSGALPATFIFDNQGKLVNRLEGKATYAEFVALIQPVLEEQQ